MGEATRDADSDDVLGQPEVARHLEYVAAALEAESPTARDKVLGDGGRGMIGFEDFVSPTAAGDGNAAELLLPTGTGASGARRALEVVFGSDDDLEVSRLVIGGEDIGVVRRDVLVDLTYTSVKRGFGEGDGGKLPGTTLYDTVIKLTCPVPACPAAPSWTVAYDEDDPPRCRVHPDTALRDAR